MILSMVSAVACAMSALPAAVPSTVALAISGALALLRTIRASVSRRLALVEKLADMLSMIPY